MENFEVPSGKRQFFCVHCKGRVLIPHDLPPTTGPCPHCGGTVTSPVLEPTAPLPAAVGPESVPARPAPAPTSSTLPLPAVPITSPLPAAGKSARPETPAPVAIPSRQDAAAPEPAAKPAATLPTRAMPASPAGSAPPVAAGPTPVPPNAAPVSALGHDLSGAVPETRGAPAAQTAPPPGGSPPEPPAEQPPRSAAPPAPATQPAGETARERKGIGVFVPVLVVLLLLIGGVAAVIYIIVKNAASTVAPPPSGPAAAIPPAQVDSSVREENYLRIGWRKEAYRVLSEYMEATTAEGKLPHILHADALAERVADFYGGGVIHDSDTPAEAFSAYELSIEDRRRGLFMMIFDQPPQFDMKEFFRPLASLEVQHQLEEPGLVLSTFARASNFAMEPLRVHAFFKRTPDGLKLDWEVFSQTKYRTLRSFIELPEIGLRGVFRVFIAEDVPQRHRMEAGTRTYRLADPATPADSARVNVKVDSETGRALAPINWRGIPDARPSTRTATIELLWGGDSADPQLEISRFICWEFLGLGGDESAANEAAEQ